MFNSTRLKLTAWYLAIIMVISISFSFTIYNILTNELHRSYERVLVRYNQIPHDYQRFMPSLTIESGYLEAAETRIRLNLLYINFIIFGASGVAGFFLAGITLRPIKRMIEEQNRFITDASHELRTPLTSLKTSIEVFLRAKNHKSEDYDEVIKSNLEDVNNLKFLTDNLLSLTQLESSTSISTPIQRLDISKVVDEACKKIAPLSEEKNIKILAHVDPFYVQADPTTLLQFFLIFLDNAIKYSPSNTTVTISSKIQEKSIVLSIKDQGFGIPQKSMKHIFNRFYRVDDSRTKQISKGYGLGLSIAKRIVQLYNGSLSVQSSEQGGSTFFITFPGKI